MLMLSGYDIAEILYEGNTTIVYRGRRLEDGQSVVIKALKAEYPQLIDITRLRHEYQITSEFNCPGIVQSYSLEPCGNGLALILEDFGGQSLAQFLKTQSLSLAGFLDLAIALADI